MNGALLDTSFLITLSNEDRENHLVAKEYYRACLSKVIPMYLSVIVISEFEVRQPISDLPLHNFLVLPFNFDDARAAASLSIPGIQARPAGYSRDTAKDDVKLLAQCEISGISHFLTDDNQCVKKIESLRKQLPARPLPVGVWCGEAFDEALFNPGSQRDIPGFAH